MLCRFVASRSRTVSASSTSYGGEMTVPRSPTVAGSNRSPRNGAQRERPRAPRPCEGEPSLTIRASYESARPGDTESAADARRSSEGVTVLTGQPRRPLWDAYDVAMLDLDGVVYVGRDAVPGAPEHLAAARDAGMHLAFVTNNASRPPGAVAEHLRELGVDVADERRRHLRPGGGAAARRASSPDGAAVFVHRRRGPRGRARASEGLRPVQDLRGRSRSRWSPASRPDLRWATVIAGAILVRDGLPWVASNTDLTVPDARRARARATACWSSVVARVRRAASRWWPASRSRRCSRRRCAGSAASARWWSATGWTPTSRAPTAPGYDSPAGDDRRDRARPSWSRRRPELRPTYVAADLAGARPRPPAPAVDGRPTRPARRLDARASRTAALVRRRRRRAPDDWWRVVAAAAAWRHLDAHRRRGRRRRRSAAPGSVAAGSREHRRPDERDRRDATSQRPSARRAPRRTPRRCRDAAGAAAPSPPATRGRRGARLAVEGLDERPVAEHVAVFEPAHDQLRARARRRRPTTPAGARADRGRRAAVPPRRLRLDAELVRRGLARSREHASELIAAGRVKVAGARGDQAGDRGDHRRRASWCAEDPDRPDYVSRGGHKLAGALAAFEPPGLAVAGRRCLDAGASTGGFTDVLLRAGAARGGGGRRRATASWPGRCSRTSGCVVHDRTNVRELTPELVGGPVDLVVGDLSFISLELVLDALLGVTAPDGDLALMVKPQFEVGKDRVGKGGVVRDPDAARRGGRRRSPTAAARRGWGARAVTTSPLPGPVGQRRVLPVAAARAGRRSARSDDPRRGTSHRGRWGCRVRRWTRDRRRRDPATSAASCVSPTPAATRPATSRAQFCHGAAPSTASSSGCSPTRPPSCDARTSTGVEVVDGRPRDAGRGLRAAWS